MSRKLNLRRDFTRFVNDPTFPYKVTACIGGELVLCSGMLLAQQSSVLEKKIREDDGMLRFDEMLDTENSNEVFFDCINFLHGADIAFTLRSIEVILKFASCYKVDDMFEKGLLWLENYLASSKSVELALDYLKISNFLRANESLSLKSTIGKFFKSNCDVVRMKITDILDTSFSGYNIAFVLAEMPAPSGFILKKWATFSAANREFIVENKTLFDFIKIFCNSEDFLAFIAYISTGELSVELMKSILDIQNNYFTLHVSIDDKDSMKGKRISKSLPTAITKIHCIPHSTESNVSSVIIHNVPSSASEFRLRSLFKYFGSIDSVHRKNSEKIAIITFQDSASVSKLLRSPCNFAMDGHNLLIDSYYVDKRIHHDYANYVYVGNMPKSANERKLMRLFKFAGKILTIDIDWNGKNSFAILKFEDIACARKLLECGRRFTLGGQELDLGECEEYSTDDEMEEDSIQVYVGNVPKSASKEDLKNLVSGFGRVANIVLKTKKPNANQYAFIKFEKIDSAIALIKSCQCTQYVLHGNVLNILKSRHSSV